MAKLKIEEMFAFVADNEEGEGIMAFGAKNGMIMPMIGADMTRVKSLYPLAVKIAKVGNKDFKLLKFSKREDITKQYI
jgi:hypothetical protein